MAWSSMLEQPFWEKHLRARYPGEYQVNDEIYDQQMEMLEDQRAADAGTPISEQEYSLRIKDLGYKRLELGRRLTRTLLNKYGL